MLKGMFTYGPFAFIPVLWLVYILPGRFKVRQQAVWTMVFLLALAKFLGFQAFGGNMFAPDLPAAVIWAWDWLYSATVILAALALVVLPLGFVPVFGEVLVAGRNWYLPLVAAVLSAVGVYNGLGAPDLVERELWYPELPLELDGYRIVHLADTHISAASGEWRTRRIVETVNAAKADLVCHTGDLADGKASRLRSAVAPLQDLKARDGVWFVTGNHEYYGDYEGWNANYRHFKFRFLDSETVSPHARLALAGLPERGAAVRGFAPPEPQRLFAKVPRGDFRLLLEHRPVDAAKDVAKAGGADLVLCGHTHGGIMPLLAHFVREHNGGFVRGLYALAGGGRLFVSPGTGQWGGFPVRFFNPAEITVFTLRRGRDPKEGTPFE